MCVSILMWCCVRLCWWTWAANTCPIFILKPELYIIFIGWHLNLGRCKVLPKSTYMVSFSDEDRLWCTYSLDYRINPQLKIFPSKCTIFFCLNNICWNFQWPSVLGVYWAFIWNLLQPVELCCGLLWFWCLFQLCCACGLAVRGWAEFYLTGVAETRIRLQNIGNQRLLKVPGLHTACDQDFVKSTWYVAPDRRFTRLRLREFSVFLWKTNCFLFYLRHLPASGSTPCNPALSTSAASTPSTSSPEPPHATRPTSSAVSKPLKPLSSPKDSPAGVSLRLVPAYFIVKNQ